MRQKIMRRKNKIKRSDSKLAGDYVKIGEKCRDCVYSTESKTFIARCTHSGPETTYRQNIGWICFSFSQKLIMEGLK